MRERPEPARLPRRRVLRALALAPAALAGCAAARPELAAPPAPVTPPGPQVEPGASAAAPSSAAAPAAAPPPPALAAIRAYRLPADAEPAFVFRAAAVRPGEPR